MNFKTLAAPVAAITLAITGVMSAPQAKADFASCNSYGNSTNCYGTNGSSYNSYGIGNNYRSYSGTDSNGNYYSGSCTRIGSYTSCNTY
ncbi:hypothetical protein OAL13_00065 [bacterium]|nr:hypothetical protein [bacterium]